LPSTLAGDDPTENCIEKVHESGRADQGRRLHLGFDEKESGKIAEQMIEIHHKALTLAFHN
jgi:hypothetical protein